MVLALKSEIREESFLEFICWLVAGAGCVRVERRLEAYTQHLVFWDRAEMMSGFPHPSRVPRLFILYLHFLIAIACLIGASENHLIWLFVATHIMSMF